MQISQSSAQTKNRWRLGLTTLAGLALAVAVSVSNAKNPAQSKKSPAVDAASSARVAQSSKTMPASPLPQTTSSYLGVRAVRVLPAPKGAQVVLYDQYNNAGGTGTLSATFDDFPTFSADLADDFVVPAGETWNVESIDADGVYFNGTGPATDWNVFIYADNAGLPGMQVFSATNQPVTVVGTTFTVTLPTAAVLTAGTYWVEIQANMDFATQGEWGWSDRTVQSGNSAAWQNTGGGFGVCPSWTTKLTCVPTATGPDQVYRLNGTMGGACTPGPWAQATPYPITDVRYGFAQTATHFYVFGGVSGGTRVNTVNRMDIATGMWQSRAAMPFASEAPTCALDAATGIVYCTEGDTGTGFASYNIATDTWTPLASIPGTDHYGSASGAFNGKVFVAGGTTGFVNTVQVYDVATNTWSAGTPAPNDFLLAGYQQVGQYLYVVGGFEAAGPNRAAGQPSSVLYKGQQPAVPSANNLTTWRLDMTSAPGVWSTGPAFTPGRADFGLAYDAGTNKLYALGGDATGGGFFDSTNEVDELDVASWPGGTWMASPPNLILPNRQANQAGFYGAGKIWSVGGLVGQTFQFLAEVQSRANCGGGSITCPPCPLYVTTTTAGNAIVPGVTDIGNHCDDCPSPVTLPFDVVLYGTTYPAGTMIQVSSNGSVDFIGSASPFGDVCPLPDTRIDRSILPFQGDLYTINAGYGIFTDVVGSAPNRDFIIEWRAQYFPGTGNANFEVILHENTPCFDVIYGATDSMGSTEESGVQKSTSGPATQFSCNAATLTPGLKVTYCPNTCPAPVPTSAVSRKTHGAAGDFDINLPLVPIGGAVGIEDRQQGAAGPVTLWYNGDANGVNGLANEQDTSLGAGQFASTYDNFLVPAGPGWDVTSVFSDNLENTVVTGANWEIRSGTTLLGTGGTLVASGTTMTPTVTPTGRSFFGLTEFQILVTGLTVHLPPNNPGEFYWLNVTPIGDGVTGRSFDSSTSGANAIGMPPGNDQNAFFNSNFFAANWTSTADQGQPYDFSMGVKGLGVGGGYAHQIVVTFATPVTVDTATITAGSGTVASFTGSGTNTITINLTDVTNAQRLGVTLGNVCDGTVAGDVLIPMGVLGGDTNANGSVNAGDVSQTKGQSGSGATAANFREDVNANGSINAGDVGLVKGKSGTVLPP